MSTGILSDADCTEVYASAPEPLLPLRNRRRRPEGHTSAKDINAMAHTVIRGLTLLRCCCKCWQRLLPRSQKVALLDSDLLKEEFKSEPTSCTPSQVEEADAGCTVAETETTSEVSSEQPARPSVSLPRGAIPVASTGISARGRSGPRLSGEGSPLRRGNAATLRRSGSTVEKALPEARRSQRQQDDKPPERSASPLVSSPQSDSSRPQLGNRTNVKPRRRCTARSVGESLERPTASACRASSSPRGSVESRETPSTPSRKLTVSTERRSARSDARRSSGDVVVVTLAVPLDTNLSQDEAVASGFGTRECPGVSVAASVDAVDGVTSPPSVVSSSSADLHPSTPPITRRDDKLRSAWTDVVGTPILPKPHVILSIPAAQAEPSTSVDVQCSGGHEGSRVHEQSSLPPTFHVDAVPPASVDSGPQEQLPIAQRSTALVARVQEQLVELNKLRGVLQQRINVTSRSLIPESPTKAILERAHEGGGDGWRGETGYEDGGSHTSKESHDLTPKSVHSKGLLSRPCAVLGPTGPSQSRRHVAVSAPRQSQVPCASKVLGPTGPSQSRRHVAVSAQRQSQVPCASKVIKEPELEFTDASGRPLRRSMNGEVSRTRSAQHPSPQRSSVTAQPVLSRHTCSGQLRPTPVLSPSLS